MPNYQHPDGRTLKLGAAPKREDPRTFRLRNFLKASALPPLPPSADVDTETPGLVDNFMFANDALGDCVIAGRAHMTLRFEEFEQKVQIPILDSEVKAEYFKETGGPDSGLDILTSLNAWRKGWTAAGQNYCIYAFAALDLANHDEVKYAVMLLRGAYTGVVLPVTAQAQTGKVWDVVTPDSPDSQPGSWGGHCIYVVAYNSIGPVCITWGARQQMTWAFWDKYVDQSYAVVDNRDPWVDPAASPLDVNVLDALLAEITNTPPAPDPPVPNPSPAPPDNPGCLPGSRVLKAWRDTFGPKLTTGVDGNLIMKLVIPAWLTSKIFWLDVLVLAALAVQYSLNNQMLPANWVPLEGLALLLINAVANMIKAQNIARLKDKVRSATR